MILDYRNFGAMAKETRKLVGFKLDDVDYGIDIMRVREVIPPGVLILVPALPVYVKGVTDHRKAVVPIIDLRTRFNLETATLTPKTKWIIIGMRGRDVGLEVDRVTQVVALEATDLRAEIPAIYMEKPWIKNVYQTSQSLLFELDLDAVVDPQKIALPPADSEGRIP